MVTWDVRRMRWALAGFACLAAIASAPLAVTTFGPNGLSLPAVGAAERLMSMLDARSPGEREQGALTQSKPRKQVARSERPANPDGSPLERLARAVVPAPPPAMPAIPPAAAIVPIIPPAVADVISPGGIGSASLPGGSAVIIGAAPPGSGGGSSAPPVGAVPPVDVTSPVPEPSSWLMMLLGFGVIGAAARRRSFRAVQAAA